MTPPNLSHLKNLRRYLFEIFEKFLRNNYRLLKKYLFMMLPALLIVILIPGCALKDDEEELYSKSIAERKFIQICKDDYNWDVTTKFIGNALWVYIPYEQDIFKFKANRFPQISKFSVVSLDGNFADGEFNFGYQIVPISKSEESRGYTYGLTDKINRDFYYLLNTIYRVYFNAQQQPEFYVVVMADILNGVEVIYTIYGLDLKKIYSSAIAQEEYYKRILQDIKGSFSIVQDKQGLHLTYQEISLGQFLTKQIIQRIRIRFLAADFKLRGTIEYEILKIISYCLRTYEFQNFSIVTLTDRSTETTTTNSRLALEEIKEL